jgi:hypothetical protein
MSMIIGDKRANHCPCFKAVAMLSQAAHAGSPELNGKPQQSMNEWN